MQALFDEGFLLPIPLYKKLLAETLQSIESLGLPEKQEQAIKQLIKKNFYYYLNELGRQVDYPKIQKILEKDRSITLGSWYDENYEERVERVA